MKYIILLTLIAAAFSRPAENNPEYGDLPEGDIEVEKTGGKVPPPSIFNAVWDKRYLWKVENGNEEENVLYYDVKEDDYNSEQLADLAEGVRDLQESTMVDGQLCIELRRIDSGGNDLPENYVWVESYSGCSSYVGRVAAAQRMSLVNGCFSHGTIMHEFLHALGFFHEHMREDRDDYVTIHWDNIEPGYESAFEKLEEGVSVDHLGTPYDYGSVLHYHETAFAIDSGQNTITPHDPDAEIGQRTRLSDLDIERVQILYGCLNTADSKHFKGWTMEDIFRRA